MVTTHHKENGPDCRILVQFLEELPQCFPWQLHHFFTSLPKLVCVCVCVCVIAILKEMVFPLWLEFHFPKDSWCWASFCVLIGHLYVFFRELSIQVLCPFLLAHLFLLSLSQLLLWQIPRQLWQMECRLHSLTYWINSYQPKACSGWCLVICMSSVTSYHLVYLLKSSNFPPCLGLRNPFYFFLPLIPKSYA
jgi:hypothetical protein